MEPEPAPDTWTKLRSAPPAAAHRTAASRFVEVKDLVLKTFEAFSADRVPRLAAAFSFYAVLSMAPMLVLAVVGGSIYYGHRLSAQQALLAHVQVALGPEVGQLFREILKGAMKGGSTTVAATLSLVVTFFAASNLFLQLDDAVNSIWKIESHGPLIRSFIVTRLSAFAGVLVFGIATLIWLVFDSWLYLIELATPGFAGWELVSFLVSILFLCGFFAVVFRTFPKGKAQWRDVLPGAALVAIGISVGKWALNVYFTSFKVSAAYGSAGSIVIILLWVYYTSQIYFFGVELTYTYAHRFGSMVSSPETPAP